MIVFSKEQITEMEEHASYAYPEECCGILLGIREEERRIVQEICRVHNAAAQPQEHFVIASDTILHVEQRALRRGLDIVGFYHSHPDHDACLSKEDREYVIPEMSYPVISMIAGYRTDFVSWVQKRTTDEMIPETILINK